ncbi:MAG: helix-turn-helix domain-containing protein [Verrucomicrobiales bacterium]|nr:helix-turn-helix domain-containing protein [Verrucomicrobiales bacterium]
MKDFELKRTNHHRALLTTKELARELKVTERTVQNLVSRGTIRKIQIGRCVRFRLSEVIADLKNQE